MRRERVHFLFAESIALLCSRLPSVESTVSEPEPELSTSIGIGSLRIAWRIEWSLRDELYTLN